MSRISADITTDQRTGLSYYTIRIGMPRDEIARLGEVTLVPGMPVEAFVQTGDRTMISYLVKPLFDQFIARVPGKIASATRRISLPGTEHGCGSTQNSPID